MALNVSEPGKLATCLLNILIWHHSQYVIQQVTKLQNYLPLRKYNSFKLDYASGGHPQTSKMIKTHKNAVKSINQFEWIFKNW